jgi:signal transduction histidine kinase
MNSASVHPNTVMVVDDNVENLNLLCAILERVGFKALPALSGDMALKALAAKLPDLMLLDVRMPGMDGYTLCKHLKSVPRTHDIPVIFISANGDLADRIAAFDAGGVDYVTKPFCEEEILARVRAQLRVLQDRQHLEEMVTLRTQELLARETQLQELSTFLQKVREEDRVHFARELHDELGQNLTAMRIDFNALSVALASADPTVVARLRTIDQMINSTVDATRRICEDLRPGMLDDLGLEAALSSFTARFTQQFGVQCDLSLDREDYELDDRLSTAIFRIVQESLTNIARHAKASHALVSLEDRGAELLLVVADDGCGLAQGGSEDRRKPFGILGMRERVKMLGGRISIDSFPGRGTHVEVCIPRSRERRS